MIRAIVVKRKDFNFSEHGDFIIEHGDLKDTMKFHGLGFMEEVELRIKSSYGDWYFEEEKGANLHVFEGRMISDSLISSIEESISNALTFNDFLSTSDFNVEAIAIDINEVAVKVVFSDNIRKLIDYRLESVRIVFDLKTATPRIVRT
jgi:hypothetical protein